MTRIWRRIYFRKLSEIDWNSLQMGNQLVFLHFLPNWDCSQRSCSTTSILSQALDTWISVELCFFNDEEIDVCLHIFHILSKIAKRTAPRNCIPFYCLISKNLKLKGVHLLEDESPYPKPSQINIRTLNASIGHSQKGVKLEGHAHHGGSHSSSHSYDEKLDNIMASVQELSTKMSRLATIMHSHHINFKKMKFTSLQNQLDQIQRKLEEEED